VHASVHLLIAEVAARARAGARVIRRSQAWLITGAKRVWVHSPSCARVAH